ncbi:hypothetical protein CIG75_04845 [Tumebacillus algifaecis]|uniref:Uncharacterized protein n=1 Tax=Tumebacillus algifaecis TaxID=1214604 RepID=A0A223CZ78_9BACL|nr:hypothetical protein CIG75_04845 [Tumebacillus algifaecis]
MTIGIFEDIDVQAQDFHQAMTKLEENMFGVDGLSNPAQWQREGAMFGVNGKWGYLYKCKTRQSIWMWCGHEFEAETETDAKKKISWRIDMVPILRFL